MTKQQRYRYEMFVRVRDFGEANRELFPESSSGSQSFVRVAAAVTAIEGHLRDRIVVRAEARKLQATMRAEVLRYMRTIAATGRRAARREMVGHPFRLPKRRTAKVLVATGRAFIEEARRREAEFVRLGLAPTFITDFQTVLDDLDRAVDVRNNSLHLRRRAQAGIEAALAAGLDDIRELDVIVPNVLRDDQVRVAQWQRARHIDGQRSSAPPADPPVDGSAPVPDAPDSLTESPTGALPADAAEETTAAAEDVALPKAS